MLEPKLLGSFLNSMKNPFMYCDNDHMIRFMNKAALKHYKEGESLLGTSIFDCHNDISKEKILEIYNRFTKGENEICIGVFKGEKITVVAVYGNNEEIIGYFERFEKAE